VANLALSVFSVVLLIFGTIWRFDHYGQVCSGDLAFAKNMEARENTLEQHKDKYYIDTGYFLKVILAIQWTILCARIFAFFWFLILTMHTPWHLPCPDEG
jgi:hypothetical protein